MPITGRDEKTSEFIFTWEIENFTACLLNIKHQVISPSFRVEQLQNTEWNLILNLPGDQEDVVLNLLRSTSDQGPVIIQIKGKLFIAKNNGSSICLEKENVDFKKDYRYIDALIMKRKSILENSIDFLQNDILTVGYEFSIISDLTFPTVIECSGRSKLCLKENSFLLPLNMKFSEAFSNWEYSSLPTLTASTSTEYPTFEVSLKYYHPSNTENVISVEIGIIESQITGYLWCKLTFFSDSITIHECEEDYSVYSVRDVKDQFWVINISKDTFHKSSIFDANFLKCELVGTTGKYTSFLETTKYRQKVRISNLTCFGESDLQKNLKEMYLEKNLCDFKVVVSGKEFSVHKTIFAAVSPVFRAMFESGLSESEKSEVTIEEFSAEVVGKMIDFLYANTIENLNWNMALELYSIADKYEIKHLKTVCSSFLESTVSVETVPELLSLSDLHKDEHLQNTAQKFVCDHSKAVFRSQTWNLFMKSNLQVASETMYRFCKL